MLTHCNAGAIATGGYGTALGVVRSAFTQGKVEMVYCDETRPLLQGARLTAWELVKDGISGNYLAMHRAGLFPNSYDFDENGWPIEKRTAYHMSMSAEIINTFDQMYPDKPLKISGLPDANEMIANGLEATLKSLA